MHLPLVSELLLSINLGELWLHFIHDCKLVFFNLIIQLVTFFAVGVDLAGLTFHAEALKVSARVDLELGMFNSVV